MGKRSIFSLQRRREKKEFRDAVRQADKTDEALGLDLPPSEKTVVKTVPAKANDEVIGTAVIYDDGSIDIITVEGISEEAKQHVRDFQKAMTGED